VAVDRVVARALVVVGARAVAVPVPVVRAVAVARAGARVGGGGVHSVGRDKKRRGGLKKDQPTDFSDG
jgi:hypothetical protein